MPAASARAAYRLRASKSRPTKLRTYLRDRGMVSHAAVVVLMAALLQACAVVAVFRPGGGSASDIKIGAFNVQAFGKSKSENPVVMDIVAKVVKQFDIILLQEVRGSSGEVIDKLLDLVNSRSKGTYDQRSSEQLGRGAYKERYVFLYRSDKISVKDVYQYPDESQWFARPPFAILLKIKNSGVPELAFAGVHTSPNDAVSEIGHLADVYEALVKHWPVKNVIFGGDFNAGCSYVRNGDWTQMPLWTDTRFTWLIDSCIDTTAKRTTCSYDRFVTAGSELLCIADADGAGPYRYDVDQNIVDTDTILDVSDHYPIGMRLLPTKRCPPEKTSAPAARREPPSCRNARFEF